MRRRSTSGFTLIEVLIAVTLVGLLSVGMLYAMRAGYDALARTNNRLFANRKVLGAQRVLESQITGFIPVLANCAGNRRLYFGGGPAGMTFVSSYSLQEAARGYARVLDYAVIAGENGQGVRLVVSETPYTGPSSAQKACGGLGGGSEAGPGSFVLADKLASCRISYLIRVREGAAWSDGFGGLTPPAAIHIEMKPLEPDPSRLQMSSMTVLVRANRDPGRKYEDVDELRVP